MLQFITLIFPGILFAYVAEYLMKRRLDTHHFIFLSLFNILTINFIAMPVSYTHLTLPTKA